MVSDRELARRTFTTLARLGVLYVRARCGFGHDLRAFVLGTASWVRSGVMLEETGEGIAVGGTCRSLRDEATEACDPLGKSSRTKWRAWTSCMM